MNREKAIQCLQVMKGAECINALSTEFPEHYGQENIIALEMAIEALEAMPEYERLKERDTTYKPMPDNRFYGNGICKCGAIFMDKDMQFCGNCGQRIDWSEEKDHEN